MEASEAKRQTDSRVVYKNIDDVTANSSTERPAESSLWEGLFWLVMNEETCFQHSTKGPEERRIFPADVQVETKPASFFSTEGGEE